MSAPVTVACACARRTLSLHDNSFSGSIPDFSGALNLSYVDVHNNALTGTLPQFGSLLTYFSAGDNLLSGTIGS